MADSEQQKPVQGGRLTSTFLFAVIVAAFGSSFQYGYNVGVVNAPEKSIEKFIEDIWMKTSKESKETLDQKVIILYSLIVSIMCIGGMVGGLLTEIMMSIFGLKYAIWVNNMFIFVASSLMGFSKMAGNYYILIIGRFLVGINCGLGAALTPMYLTEISPVNFRGAIGSAYQLFLTISILIAQLVGLDVVFGNDEKWPYLFFLISGVAVFQVLLFPFCPNSPPQLYGTGKEEAARKALIWLRQTGNVGEELEQIKKDKSTEQSEAAVGFGDLFSKPQYRTPLIISCMLMIGQQFSGINAIIYYSTSTFEYAKLGKYAQYGTLAIGGVNVAMTVISVAIVDKVGRKPLLVFGFAAMLIDTLVFCASFVIAANYNNVSASYCCIGCLILFIIFFASGVGSIPWFIMSELFSQASRSKAVCIAVAVHWVANFMVGLSFPTVQKILGPYVFLIFAALQLIFLIYIVIAVPETKNKTIEEITAQFKSKKEEVST